MISMVLLNPVVLQFHEPTYRGMEEGIGKLTVEAGDYGEG